MAFLQGIIAHYETWQNDFNNTHNPKVVGSNPASATIKNGATLQVKSFFLFA
jgi:hypothetical protein